MPSRFVLILSILCLGALLLLGACTSTPAIEVTRQPIATPTAAAVAEATATVTAAPTATTAASDTPSPSPSPTVTPTPGPGIAEPIVLPTVAPPTPCPEGATCGPAPAPTPASLVATENILLLGTDLRPTEGGVWRTDTLLLVAIDWKNDRVGVLSFPRDLLVDVPVAGQGRRKINVIDYMGEKTLKLERGGFGLLADTFQQNFGVRIDHFARLHRDGFVRIIDTVGGVEVTLDCDLWELSPKGLTEEEGYNVLYIPAGPQRLNGVEALDFATFRYRTGDWDRARRQQVVLLSLRNQLIRPETLGRVPELWDALKDNFSTDLNVLDLLRYATLGASIDLENVHAHVMSTKTELDQATLENGAYVLLPRGDKVLEAINALFEARPIFEQANRPSGCPPPPSWAAEYGTPTPTATPTPAP